MIDTIVLKSDKEAEDHLQDWIQENLWIDEQELLDSMGESNDRRKNK